ncbi:hypothetical protein RAB80_005562 [Fusarium oxysporum f. sp. vasinfectum]|uniref:Uncharacterized protein n=1 Tax=Fusarium oxysporum f. sp. vasinfectum 25433 TaxID=1089449 RepID=X0M5E5_FUSOX|nr:hypothetical protein FOTG_15825 [Fusarium oxysporum f. sp. vasinfectum 25433]KAK2676822.1 hypothetical protein RAB80_005562 [Fusarium oxysporum f. sp. vasinfectum]KAK2939789.1 hypothetical protein FoTM2_003009 [Fusarium oxysporum f. sp. vasinfectum]
MSKLDRFTLFIDDVEANLIQLRNGSRKELPEEVPENRGKRSRAGQTEQPPAKRFPVKRSDSNTLIPVVFRSPWKHYMKRYTVRHWCLFVVGTCNNRDKQPFIIRGLSGSMNKERIQRIRNLCDYNIVQSVEIYSDPDDGYFLVSQMMETSLLHVRRAPVYPSEPKLVPLPACLKSRRPYPRGG